MESKRHVPKNSPTNLKAWSYPGIAINWRWGRKQLLSTMALNLWVWRHWTGNPWDTALLQLVRGTGCAARQAATHVTNPWGESNMCRQSKWPLKAACLFWRSLTKHTFGIHAFHRHCRCRSV
jgi:hypothetical protein